MMLSWTSSKELKDAEFNTTSKLIDHESACMYYPHSLRYHSLRGRERDVCMYK